MPLKVVGTKRMSWGEALRLTKILERDGSSRVGATLGEWKYPATVEAQILMDLLDKFMDANFKNHKPHPRPWPTPPTETPGRVGDTGGRTRREVIEHLNSLGHHLPLPDDDDEAG